jgi:hypothetical protein
MRLALNGTNRRRGVRGGRGDHYGLNRDAAEAVFGRPPTSPRRGASPPVQDLPGLRGGAVIDRDTVTVRCATGFISGGATATSTGSGVTEDDVLLPADATCGGRPIVGNCLAARSRAHRGGRALSANTNMKRIGRDPSRS